MKLSIILFITTFCVSICIGDDVELAQPKAIPITITEPTLLNYNRLLEYCPSATGEVQVVIDGQWRLLYIDDKEIPIPSGPMICYVITEGIDLGVGYG